MSWVRTIGSVIAFAAMSLGAGRGVSADAGACDRISPRVHAVLSLQGVAVEGGVPGGFTKIVDLETGFSRTERTSGPMRNETGFDGEPWSAVNGIVTRIDAPGWVEDARAQAFIDRLGWLDQSSRLPVADGESSGSERYAPDGGSRVTLERDPASQVADHVTLDGDAGPSVTTLSDWRCLDGLLYPFHQVQIDATGAVTELKVDSASLSARAPPHAFEPPPQQPHGRLTRGKRAEIPFEFFGKNDWHIVVPARIDSGETRLIFDTGAGDYIGADAAARLKIAIAGGLNLTGAGEGSTTGGFGRLTTISIGDAELRDETAIVGPIPWPSGAAHPRAPEGLTGFEFLAEFRTTIDYERRLLRFESFASPLPIGARLPFVTDEHTMYVTARVNGKSGLFRIDTGDGGSITLFKTFADSLGLQPASVAPSPEGGRGLGGDVPVTTVQLDDFQIGDEALSDPAAQVSQTKAGGFALRTVAGNLGAEFLRCFTLTVDFHARVIILSRTAGTDACLAELKAPAPPGRND